MSQPCDNILYEGARSHLTGSQNQETIGIRQILVDIISHSTREVITVLASGIFILLSIWSALLTLSIGLLNWLFSYDSLGGKLPDLSQAMFTSTLFFLVIVGISFLFLFRSIRRLKNLAGFSKTNDASSDNVSEHSQADGSLGLESSDSESISDRDNLQSLIGSAFNKFDDIQHKVKLMLSFITYPYQKASKLFSGYPLTSMVLVIGASALYNSRKTPKNSEPQNSDRYRGSADSASVGSSWSQTLFKDAVDLIIRIATKKAFAMFASQIESYKHEKAERKSSPLKEEDPEFGLKSSPVIPIENFLNRRRS